MSKIPRLFGNENPPAATPVIPDSDISDALVNEIVELKDEKKQLGESRR